MLSDIFIKRPVLATVLGIIIVMVGGISVFGLPIQQYPTIAPVQIQVTTVYAGANAETVAASVAAPIEAQINGVPDMLYMTSTSSASGQMTINVYFKESVDPDIAQVLVQNRVNLATPQLPASVNTYGVTVQQQSSNVLMIIAITADAGRYPLTYVTNFANLQVLNAIQRIDGAGQATMFGDPNQAMRIWLNPNRMASLGISAPQVANVIKNQNQLIGAGQLGQPPNDKPVVQTFPMTVQQQFTKPSEYENLILRANSGDGSAIVRLGDVGRAEMGFQQYLSTNQINGQNTALIVVYQQPGANGIDVSNQVRQTLLNLKPLFPAGINYTIALDTTDFVRLSIKEVVKTLFEALILVIIVMYVFLQSVRASAIATTAIIISITGTFAGMLVLGFSLNLLTLFGLVLAIGLVVDDAIVVIENATRNIEEGGHDPQAAVHKAMAEVTGPVIATVLVLAAVFVPAAFISGPTGQLYKQFAITIAVSVAISGFVALTVTPAMAALFLKPGKPVQRGPFAWFNAGFKKLEKGYGKTIALGIRGWLAGLLVFGGMIYFTVDLFRVLPTSFVPNEDQGYVLTIYALPDAASLDRTQDMAQHIDKMFADDPAVLYRISIAGYSLVDSQYRNNYGTMWVQLKPFEQRPTPDLSADAVIKRFMAKAGSIDKAFTLAINPPSIPGLGTQAGFDFWLMSTGDQTAAELQDVTQKFMAAAKQRPELAGLSTGYRATGQQLKLNIDRDKALLLGVPLGDLYFTIQSLFGSATVSQFTELNRVWNVIVQADSQYRATPADLTTAYVTGDKGQQVPLSALVTLDYEPAPTLVSHFNGFQAAQITGDAAPGYSSGQSLQAMKDVAADVLPQGYTYGWSGLAYSQEEAGNSSAIVFMFGIILVFLILAAQYESWSLPAAVMTTVPFGVLGALIATYGRGLDNDVYFQIGLLLMVGLAAKNGILIVEFAVEKLKEGRTVTEAAVEAGELRLRPIIMTSLAFIFGTIPMAIATGAGANARHSIGTGIIGGMVGASTLALLFVPIFFYLFKKGWQKREAEILREEQPPPPPAPQEGSPA
ncbi:hydrophobe/amphiphile efflux-1 family RND transporter [Aestuariivirga litoralis]|uniref:Efflux pump membrane transporter n=1 Tax=Aestuariivirga litoralis TaxID=2650924 RepID=A0A2W2CFN5_9HYPH|nr:efflux RND transporter permease subunit [Aestuariivirga litoralis]PZF78943.1 hydrophobe/amphiphile efflux-1 family RND transporter [Aestuariivirga litoralis]